MKKRSIVIILGIVCLLMTPMVPSIGPATASAEKTISLKFANYFPPAAPPSKICEAFIADIEKRTDGRVKITYYPGGSLLKSKAIFMGVTEGAADIGFSHIFYTPGRMPVTEVCSLPLGYPNPWVGTHVLNDFYDEFKPKEWDKVKVLWMHSSGVNILMTKKPVQEMADLKGMVIRAPGRIGKTINALGGSPAPTTMSEAYDALSKGVIQGVYTGVMGLKSWRFAEVIDYTTLSWQIGSVFPFYVVMNQRSWQKLPKDIQQIFSDAIEEYKEKFAVMWNASEVGGKKYGLEKGVTYFELSKEEAMKWQEAVQPVIEDYVKEMIGKGFAESDLRRWIDFLQKRIAYWTDKQIESGVKSATGPKEILE